MSKSIMVLQIGKLQLKHNLISAPMCGITHLAYRKFYKKFGADLVFTQMVSAKALALADKKTHFILRFSQEERPLGMQVFGNNATDLAKAAQICQDLGADVLDLNMGCPAKKIVNDGGGSALLNDSKLCRSIFRQMRKVLQIPFTIKMRSGWDKNHLSALEVAKIGQAEGVDAVTLHARTRAQGYKGKADWSLIKKFKQELSIPVIGNGDVKNFQDANELFKTTGCDGIMLGRAMVSAPWAIRSILNQKEFYPKPKDIHGLILEQYESFFSYFGQEVGIRQMRKHLNAYTKGLRDGARFRSEIIRMTDWSQIQVKLADFFLEKPEAA